MKTLREILNTDINELFVTVKRRVSPSDDIYKDLTFSEKEAVRNIQSRPNSEYAIRYTPKETCKEQQPCICGIYDKKGCKPLDKVYLF